MFFFLCFGCAGSSLHGGSLSCKEQGGYRLLVVGELFIAAASLVMEHRL